MPIIGRARTAEDREKVMRLVPDARIVAGDQRLGQFLINACGTDLPDLFYIEDFALARKVAK